MTEMRRLDLFREDPQTVNGFNDYDDLVGRLHGNILQFSDMTNYVNGRLYNILQDGQLAEKNTQLYNLFDISEIYLDITNRYTLYTSPTEIDIDGRNLLTGSFEDRILHKNLCNDDIQWRYTDTYDKSKYNNMKGTYIKFSDNCVHKYFQLFIELSKIISESFYMLDTYKFPYMSIDLKEVPGEVLGSNIGTYKTGLNELVDNLFNPCTDSGNIQDLPSKEILNSWIINVSHNNKISIDGFNNKIKYDDCRDVMHYLILPFILNASSNVSIHFCGLTTCNYKPPVEYIIEIDRYKYLNILQTIYDYAVLLSTIAKYSKH